MLYDQGIRHHWHNQQRGLAQFGAQLQTFIGMTYIYKTQQNAQTYMGSMLSEGYPNIPPGKCIYDRGSCSHRWRTSHTLLADMHLYKSLGGRLL